MKKILLFIGILLLINCCYADPVTNINTITYETAINVSWTGTATNYTILLENESIIYTDTAPTIDGILEPYYQNLSHTYTILTPNPSYLNQLDYVWCLADNTYEYYGADCYDADATNSDDALRVYIDLEDDGLTADDLMYEYLENGVIKRYRYNAGSWVLYPGSTAIAAVDGAGTGHFTIEIRVPLSEVDPLGITDGDYHRVMFRRSHNFPPTIFRYYPHLLTGLNIDDSSTWGHLEHAHTNTTGATLLTTTTNEFYNVTGLYPYNWYRIWIVPDLNYSEIATVTEITENQEQYLISGYVYDYDTGEPIFNSRVYANYTGITVRDTYTNITGYFEIAGLYDRTYSIVAEKDNYLSDSTSITLIDSNETGLEFYIQYQPETITIETQTTDIKIVYILIILMLVLFAISLACLYYSEGEVNAITVFCMAIPSLISFKVSNLFIDGTLITTEKFLTSIDTVIIQEDVIRNTAMSNLFELLGICFFIGVVLQIYGYIKDSGVEEELQ